MLSVKASTSGLFILLMFCPFYDNDQSNLFVYNDVITK